MKLDRILTIVDKPKHPQAAIARTVRLMQASGGRARLAAFCNSAEFEHGHFLTGAEARQVRRSVVDERLAWLQSEVSRHRALAGASLSVLWTGDIAGAVEDLLEDEPADLIIKTLHQSRTLIHTPLDWELLRRTRVPVLLTTPKRRRQSGVVLAAIDPFNNDRAHRRLNRRVLEAAITLAEFEGATVHVVTALNLNPVLADLDVVDRRTMQQRAREKAEAGLAIILKPWAIPRSRVHLQPARVGQAVDQQARLLHADVVVVGTCAHPVKQFMGIGNSAEKIVSRIQCDILAVCP